MANYPIDSKGSFCSFMQINKIMNVFWVSLRKRRIGNLMWMIMKWNWGIWLRMVMIRTKTLLH